MAFLSQFSFQSVKNGLSSSTQDCFLPERGHVPQKENGQSFVAMVPRFVSFHVAPFWEFSEHLITDTEGFSVGLSIEIIFQPTKELKNIFQSDL